MISGSPDLGPLCSPLHEKFEHIVESQIDIIVPLPGIGRPLEIKKGDTLTICGGGDGIGGQILQILPLDGGPTRIQVGITSNQIKDVLDISSEISLPPEIITMFDLLDLIERKRRGT